MGYFILINKSTLYKCKYLLTGYNKPDEIKALSFDRYTTVMCMIFCGVNDIAEDSLTVCRKRQKRKPEWRKIKYVLLKCFISLKRVRLLLCISRPEEDHSIDRKY